MDQFSENYKEQLNEAEKLILQSDDEGNQKDNFENFSKEDLLKHAESLIHTTNVKQAYNTIVEIKKAFENILSQERPQLIKEWVDAGNDPRNFVAPQDILKLKLYNIVQQFKDLREQEKKKAEEEKLVNLKNKERILESIISLANSEENENSLNAMRELMRQWREIRQIPKEFHDELYAKYKFHIDKYYDNLSKFNELKDLDREKNLEIKIDLIKKVEALKEESNIRKAMISLNKIHEDWKNAGPVRKEINDEIWDRFKAASDSLIDIQKQYQDQIDAQRTENLDKKVLLIEKAETMITAIPSSVKEWNKMAEEVEGLMEEWKKIGPVPSDQNETVWTRFQTARNTFYTERKNFFKKLQSDRKDNLTKKIALCEQAELLKEESDFMKTSEALQKLQDQWKLVGPVPEEHNEVIWKRFRAAFDYFYERKNKWFNERKSQESGAIEAKESIIRELETLVSSNQNTFSFADLKAIQQRWNESGFVSGKKYQSLHKTYQTAIDQLFQSLRAQSNSQRENSVRENLNSISNSPDAKYKFQSEERRLRELIKKHEDELNTIENNKGFFALAKNAEAVLKQFDDKAKKIKSQISNLKSELQLVVQAKKGNE